MKKALIKILAIALIALLLLPVFAACNSEGDKKETEAPSIDNNTDGDEDNKTDNTDNKETDNKETDNKDKTPDSTDDKVTNNNAGNNNNSNNNNNNVPDNGEIGNPNPENPPAHTCTFNQEVVADKYKKSDATCLKKAEYYYSCECGEKGTHTFEFEDEKKAEHKWDTKTDKCCVCNTPVVFTDGLEFELSADGQSYVVIGAGTAEGDVFLPREYNQLPVTSIGDRAFKKRSELISITIPDSVTSIGEDAFRDCIGLTSVTIPDSVTRIDFGAFWNCANLNYNENKNGKYLGNEENKCVVLVHAIDRTATSFEISPNTKIICENALLGCTKITRITIPNSVTSIGNYAFQGCAELTSIAIPNSVAIIGECAFYACDNLQSVTIGSNNTETVNSNTEIRSYAFSGCTSLTSITIGNNVKSIGNRAFYGCTGITSLTIPVTVISVGESAFYNCTGLVNLNCYAASIGKDAFNGCKGLTSVTIGNSVESIGSFAFWACYKIVEVYNLSSLNIDIQGSAGYYALDIYTSLSEPSKLTTTDDGYIFYDNGETVYLLGYIGNETELTLPDKFNNKTYAIYKNAFCYNSKITSIIIPDTVASIGEATFMYCEKLTSISFSGTIAEWEAIEKGNYWNSNTGSYTITCTDGKLDKSGNVITE